MSTAYLVVFLGAGLGGAMRHGVNVATLALFGPGFPVGTLGVNRVRRCGSDWKPLPAR